MFHFRYDVCFVQCTLRQTPAKEFCVCVVARPHEERTISQEALRIKPSVLQVGQTIVNTAREQTPISPYHCFFPLHGSSKGRLLLLPILAVSLSVPRAVSPFSLCNPSPLFLQPCTLFFQRLPCISLSHSPHV